MEEKQTYVILNRETKEFVSGIIFCNNGLMASLWFNRCLAQAFLFPRRMEAYRTVDFIVGVIDDDLEDDLMVCPICDLDEFFMPEDLQ